MPNEDRPDPDQLLAAVARNDSVHPSGKLQIFFGMSAGAGKTYAMLSAAQIKKAEGIDVVIGLVETHGRSETIALTSGLEILPRKKLMYRNTTFEEMDLDALLARKPELAIVDELAHTNVPGSRHPKRWQDVVELLDAGIDVYTTLNVQHVESRKALVESVGGIVVHETVPDALLERSAAVEMVDITPTELLKRLSEGKVYLGERAEAAALNFFKEDRLTALREMALRLTAEKVDSDLQGLLATTGSAEGWKPADRLMVAVSHSPYSEGLIRATRRIAFSLGAPWVAVHVETGTTLSEKDRAMLAKNLQLVNELGGELISTADTDIAGALERIARQRAVTQMVVGRPTRRVRDFFTGGTILDRIARQRAGYDILVLRPDAELPNARRQRGSYTNLQPGMKPISLAVAIVIAVTLLNFLLLPVLGYKAVGFVFLLSVLSVGMFVSFGAVTVAAVLSALVWDYLFIPPFGTLSIRQPEDVMMVCSYFVAALVTGTLAYRIRTRQDLIRQREERTEVLYDLARSLMAHAGIEPAVSELRDKLRPLLRGEVDLIAAGRENSLNAHSILKQSWLSGEKERAVALWAFEHGKNAGWATDTLPSAEARYIPLQSSSGRAVGVLAFRPERDRRLTQDEENLLAAVAHQLAMSLEREQLHYEAQEAERLRESEHLLQTVVDSVSHELRTPLTAIAGAASALSSPEIAANSDRRNEWTSELLAMTERLNRIVGNLLDMSRLSSGMMRLQTDWHDPRDIVSAALDLSRRELADFDTRLAFDEDLPLVRVDIRLMTQAVANVLSNAAAYSAKSTGIDISCGVVSGQVAIIVSDRGPGIPEEVLPKIFTKFYRAPGTPAGGVGLGLAITEAIVVAHGGTITAANRSGGGLSVAMMLPVEAQPEIPSEDNVS